jgi:hypothetical protein
MTYILLLLVVSLLILSAFLFLRRNYMEPNPPVQTPTRPKEVPVTVVVNRNQQGEPVELVVRPAVVILNANEQLRWSSPDGRLEIRFNPGITPFAGSNFETTAGGFSFSGAPVQRRPIRQSYKYNALVTTGDGFFLTQTAEVVVADKPEYK